MNSGAIVRRVFVSAILASGWVLPTGALPGPDRSPNIVLIMADDLGWQELGCYGQEKILTPHVDRLAAEGMRFTDYYAGAAVCAPSRCNLMTGRHGGHAIVRSNMEIKNPDPAVFGGQLPLPADEVVIAEVLKERGYATGCFGKWGLGAVNTSGDPLNQGFDRFYGYNCQRHAHNLYPRYLVDDREHDILEGNTRGLTGDRYGPAQIADELLAFVRENRDHPFFVYYAAVLPHLPLQVPEADLAQYRGQWPETPYTGRAYLPHQTPRACYAAMISFLDRQVGRVMALLNELGLDENTIVLFTSDNGTTHLLDEVDAPFFESVGPLRGLKGSLHEGGIRVPMVARWPGRIQPGTQTAHLAAHYDVPATLAALAGVSMPTDTDGISFLPTLLGRPQDQAAHTFLFWDFAGYGGQIAVRKGPWKGIRKGLRKDPDAPLELYNLDTDLAEQTDLVGRHPSIAGDLERIMREARNRPATPAFQFGTYADD